MKIEGKKVSVEVGKKGRVVFRVIGSDGGERVFSVHGNSFGETVYSSATESGAYIPKDGILDIEATFKPMAPRTSRRHRKALVEDKRLKQLA